MIATHSSEQPGLFTIGLLPESHDRPTLPNGASLRGTRASFWLPTSWRADQAHPDLLALAVMLCSQPFVGRTLRLPRGVSRSFNDAVRTNFGLDVGPVDSRLEPRSAPSAGVPGLSFSGGVDSTAAVEVLPPETVSVFLDRTSSAAGHRSLYRPDAARSACVVLRQRGRRVLMVSTDLEHLRSPVGFPTDLAAATPLVLLADLLQLDCVSWGTIAESAYRIGHLRFTDYYERSSFRTWRALFHVVGLPVLNPTVGVSEVGTSRIVRERGWLGVAQSCIRGTVEAPCLNCWKCFRKSLLDAALVGDWPSDEHLDRLFRIPEAQRQLSQAPIKHEDVVAYTMARYDGGHPEMLALKRRVRLTDSRVDHLGRWYGPSSLPWPAKYREDVMSRLDETLGRMTVADESAFRAWDVSALQSGAAARAAAAYGELLLSTNGLLGTSVTNYAPYAAGNGRSRVSSAIAPAGGGP